MARRRSTPATAEARIIAAGIAQAERRGYTQKEIGKAFGINERTVRKIKRGETPGTRIYARKVPKPKAGGTTPNVFRLDLELDDGMIRTVNLKAPNVLTAKGKRAPTPFDIFRMPGIQEAADAEAQRLKSQYGMSNADASAVIAGLRHVEHRRAAVRITITGTVRA